MPGTARFLLSLSVLGLVFVGACGGRSGLIVLGDDEVGGETGGRSSGGSPASGGAQQGSGGAPNGAGGAPNGVGGAPGGQGPAGPGWSVPATAPGTVKFPEFRVAMSDTGQDAVLFRQRSYDELERVRWASGWASTSVVPSRVLGDVWMSRDGSVDWVSFLTEGPVSSATFVRDEQTPLFVAPVTLGMFTSSSFPEFRAPGTPQRIALSRDGTRSALLTDQSDFLSSDGGPWRQAKWPGQVGPFDITSERLSVLVTEPSGEIIERTWTNDAWRDQRVVNALDLAQAWPMLGSLRLTSHPHIAYATWSATILGRSFDYLGRKDEFGEWRIISVTAASSQARHPFHRLAVSGDGSLALTSHVVCLPNGCSREQLALVSVRDGASEVVKVTLSQGCGAGAVALAHSAHRGYFVIRCDQVIYLGVWAGGEWRVDSIEPHSQFTSHPDLVTNSDGTRALFVWAEASGSEHVHRSVLFSAD